MRTRKSLACIALWIGLSPWNGWSLDFPGPDPGKARASVRKNRVTIGNDVVRGNWSLEGGTVRPLEVENRIARATLPLDRAKLFRLTLVDGRTLDSSQFKLAEKPAVERLESAPNALKLAERRPGRAVRATLRGEDGNIEVLWRVMLRDGANAIRQEVTLSVRNADLALREIQLVDVAAESMNVAGTVSGSPLVVGDLFFAIEHPESRSAVQGTGACSLAIDRAVRPDTPLRVSCVIGVVPPGQLRRGFLYYVERERAHPYRPFLHYNSWYDICWADLRINEQQCIEVVHAFGRELTANRGINLASYVWDDGWDDTRTLWQPVQTNFPNGFGQILAAARAYRSTLGFWLSPFGGYGKSAQDRLTAGRTNGFETGPQGFSLAGPRYFQRFQETCAGFIEQNGANYFKFDGLAQGVAETEAMLRLTRSLRERRADLFISLTTGTWPTPFWLWYGDSTWRGGGDMGLHGAGSKREQWMTYRDLETYRGVVQKGPLYPLNSIMNQGFAHARYGPASECGDSADEIRKELRSFFACGTCLQELYVTPSRMSQQNWDDLAECVKWARQNTDVLVDSHWVGGDPGKGEVYGWASWSPRKGILALRNPSAEPARFAFDIGRAFDLPARSDRVCRLTSPWKSDAGQAPLTFEAGKTAELLLDAFGVIVLEAVPAKRP